jgi:hypothetical protein
VLLVIGADVVTQLEVGSRCATRLNVLVLIEGRDALRGQLPTHPVGLLRQADRVSACGRREGRRHTPGSPSHHEYVTGDPRP